MRRTRQERMGVKNNRRQGTSRVENNMVMKMEENKW